MVEEMRDAWRSNPAVEVWYGAEQVPTTLSAPGGPGSVVAIGVFDGRSCSYQENQCELGYRRETQAAADPPRPA